MSKRLAPVVAAVVAVGLASCSSDDDSGTPDAAPTTPDVCDSADELGESLTALTEIEVADQGTAASLEQAWASVEDDWTDFADAVRDEYREEVDDVEAAAASVDDAVEGMQEDPSAATLDSTVTAVRTFLQEAGALVDEAGSTC